MKNKPKVCFGEKMVLVASIEGWGKDGCMARKTMDPGDDGYVSLFTDAVTKEEGTMAPHQVASCTVLSPDARDESDCLANKFDAR